MSKAENKKVFIDSVVKENFGRFFLVSNDVYEKINKNLKSTLFSHGRRTESFFTQDSKLYLTPEDQDLCSKGIIQNRKFLLDGISSRAVMNYRKLRPSENDFLYRRLVRKLDEMQKKLVSLPQDIQNQVSFAKLWNFSIVGAIILGMVSMTFIYKYLGMGASAKDSSKKIVASPVVEKILGEEDLKSEKETAKYIEEVLKKLEKEKKDEFEKEVTDMVKGYPIEKMLPYILEKDRIIVAFYIGIAKKESNWGKRVPVLDGKDCYNYVGYRGIRKKMGTGGHTCFDSPKDAVDTVSKRLKTLIEDKKLNTPAEMVIWKCGSACSKDNQEAVRKWISDVDIYFKKLKD